MRSPASHGHANVSGDYIRIEGNVGIDGQRDQNCLDRLREEVIAVAVEPPVGPAGPRGELTDRGNRTTALRSDNRR